MKTILSLFILAMSLNAYSSPVDGQLFYIMPSQELVERNVTLEVPSRGVGEVTLSGQKFSWTTDNFWTETVNNETFFYAVFKTNFQNFESTIALKGTYLKGNNKLVYYGSLYKKKGLHDVDKDISDFEYSGGFNFSLNR